MLKPSMFTEKLSNTELLVMFPDQSGRVYVAENKKFDPFMFNHWKLAVGHIAKINLKPSIILNLDPNTGLIGWEVVDKSLETPIKGKMLKAVEKLLKLPIGEPVKCAEKLRYARFFVHTEHLKTYLQQEVKECLEMGETYEPNYVNKLIGTIGHSPLPLPRYETVETKVIEPVEQEPETTLPEVEQPDQLLSQPQWDILTTNLTRCNVEKLVSIVQQFNPDFVKTNETKKQLIAMIEEKQTQSV